MVFLIIMAVVIITIIAAIIKMIANRLNGKDELDGIINIKARKRK